MTCMNLNYMKVKESYLFADIRKRIDAWLQEHPEKRILRLGIGDVTQPLTPAVIKAMHEAVEDQAHSESFHGYMPECGDPELRSAVARWYRKRGIPVEADEVFVSGGASDELGDILHLFDRSLPAMIPEPAYPAYADANIMDGREIIFPETDQENGFQPVPPEKDIRSPPAPAPAAGSHRSAPRRTGRRPRPGRPRSAPARRRRRRRPASR